MFSYVLLQSDYNAELRRTLTKANFKIIYGLNNNIYTP